MKVSSYGTDYLRQRTREIDTSEWLDILRGLQAVGAGKEDSIYELCAGEGLLIKWLRRKGYRNIAGCDLIGGSPGVEKCDLEIDDPPVASYYIFQHCIEHLDQDRVARLLHKLLHEYKAKAIVGIAPGHYSLDPTHKISFYTRKDLEELGRKIHAPFMAVVPDRVSYLDPASRDWLVIYSNVPINNARIYPILLKLFRLTCKLLFTRVRRRW